MHLQLTNIFSKLDSTTYNHSIRVMLIALEVENALKIPDKKLSEAALLHDIGKIYIPSSILDKKDKLTVLEREIIDLHPYIGYRLLQEADIDDDICKIVLYHHTTKPKMMSTVEQSADLTIYDRALMLHSIDAFEALTSDRPYHRGIPAIDALQTMLSEKGHHECVLQYLYAVASNKDYVNSAVHRKYRADTSGRVIYMLENMEKKIV